MLPVVGVTPLWDAEKQSLWMLPGYLDGLRQAGCLPMILPLTREPEEIDQILAMVDGILLTGGQDVSPELYGEAPALTGEVCEMRDAMEPLLLASCLHKRKTEKGLPASENEILRKVEGMIEQEFSFTLKISRAEIGQYIRDRL